jgi:hypothetical protein
MSDPMLFPAIGRMVRAVAFLFGSFCSLSFAETDTRTAAMFINEDELDPSPLERSL